MAFGNQNTRPNVGIGDVVKNVGTGIYNRTIGRLFSSGIRRDSRIVNARAKWSGRDSKKDWRVKLKVPTGSPLEAFFFENNQLLQPLREEMGIFWPLTPSIVIQYSANYNAMEQTHSNYPHYQYGNSQVDQMNIFGEFPVQNQDDAKHWVATVNFLRTASKMFFGEDEGYGLKGNPPPIFHLYGYGDHMFNKVPVIINTFNVELRSGIDYISTQQSDVYRSDSNIDYQQQDSTWAPTLSTISVLVSPIYSRESVKNFSMSKFVRGELNGKGANEIGFI
tara:strand:- start:7782 stop:8615 length:834 start_codon:yes stop_codon:yes gene_type:complete